MGSRSGRYHAKSNHRPEPAALARTGCSGPHARGPGRWGRRGGKRARLPRLTSVRNKLIHEGGACINFRDYTFLDARSPAFRWVDVKRLRLPAEPAGDAELLAALIGHEQFRDDYAGGGVMPDGLRHGPYWVGAVTPDAYRPVGRERSGRILWQWANQFEDVPVDLATDLRREVFDPLAAAGRVYHLRELGGAAIHDWGGVHGAFHEFVLIDRPAGQIRLLVAADD